MNNNIYNEYNEKLFWKVFHSKIIRDDILKSCYLYKINRKIVFHSKESFLKYEDYSYITTLQINWDYFRDFVDYEFIPPSVESLLFYGYNLPQTIKPGMIPPTVRSLEFNCKMNTIEEGSIPNNIIKLKFSKLFCEEIKPGAIPNSVTYLEINGYTYNKPLVEGLLPSSIKTLIFGSAFNQPISTFESGTVSSFLPPNLETLVFGNAFNQNIPKGSLPLSLTSITFGKYFNKTISPVGSIPENVKSLIFGENFNQEIENLLPINSLTELRFGLNFSKAINRQTIPLSVKHLSIIESLPLETNKQFFGLAIERVNFYQKIIPIEDLPNTENCNNINFLELLKKSKK